MRTRIIIAGGRHYNDYSTVRNVASAYLQKVEGDVEIVSGGATGADALGERFAREHNLPLKVFPADWNTYGRAAGPIRNEQMAQYAATDAHGVLLAFWDNISPGTKSMISLADRYGLEIIITRYQEDNHDGI